MYHVRAHGVDERIINVHYYYYLTHTGQELDEESHSDKGGALSVCILNIVTHRLNFNCLSSGRIFSLFNFSAVDKD